MSPAGLLAAFSALAILSLLIAAAFASQGAWMVLPFAGLEVAALCAAFLAQARHARDYEQVRIDGPRLLVESGEGGRVRRHEFSRAWARLAESGPRDAYRVAIAAQGRSVEIGRLLDEPRRREMARALQAQGISKIRESVRA
jgi:uncharacterized membrane protein